VKTYLLINHEILGLANTALNKRSVKQTF